MLQVAEAYVEAQLDEAPDFNLDFFLRFLEQCDQIVAERAAMQAPPAPPMPSPGMAPPAPPGPPAAGRAAAGLPLAHRGPADLADQGAGHRVNVRDRPGGYGGANG